MRSGADGYVEIPPAHTREPLVTTTSLWQDAPRPAYPDPLPAGGHVQVLVVGGGLTGLTSALLLARAGLEVALVEARSIGGLTTGASTGKVSLLQGTRLSRIRARHPLPVARAYVEANREGQAWLREFCETHDVPFAIQPAATYAATVHDLPAVREELAALREVGLPARWSDRLDVPFHTEGAVVLDGQLQLDPMAVVHALAEQALEHGATIHEGHRVRSLERGDRLEVTFAGGSRLTADRLVIATGAPTLAGWRWGAELVPMRSYLLAVECAAPIPAMVISAGEPIRSVRTAAPRPGPQTLLVGGAGHVVGRTRSEAEHLDQLRSWVRQHFPEGNVTHAWSAQDYSTPDELPMIGPVPGTGERVQLASGFDKWGLGSAVAAARAISAGLLGRPTSWSERLRDRSVSLRTIASLARRGLFAGALQTKGLVQAELRSLPDEVPDGDGEVGTSGLWPAGLSHVGGAECAVSAVCTHLGGILRWNDQELTWDCPLHGSRFDADGEVIEGPATRPLARLEEIREARAHHPAGKGRPSA
jgi:glycine/D-amino acid oxidase-like deaminating enzyme/nitrite reductase/ring-hydroxylating ferredoxin subunit